MIPTTDIQTSVEPRRFAISSVNPEKCRREWWLLGYTKEGWHVVQSWNKELGEFEREPILFERLMNHNPYWEIVDDEYLNNSKMAESDDNSRTSS